MPASSVSESARLIVSFQLRLITGQLMKSRQWSSVLRPERSQRTIEERVVP